MSALTLSHRPGFSLLELIVAIGIITSGIFAIVSLNLSSQNGATKALTRYRASALAREGIEVVRAIRDSNWLAACPTLDPAAHATRADWYVQTPGRCYDWNTGLADGTDYTAVPVFNSTTNRWTLDFTPNFSTSLVLSDQNLLLQGTDGVAINMMRLLELFPICRTAVGVETVVVSGATCAATTVQVGIDVRSSVTYGTGDGTKIILEERLYNWR